jgi:hypothetical protein
MLRPQLIMNLVTGGGRSVLSYINTISTDNPHANTEKIDENPRERTLQFIDSPATDFSAASKQKKNVQIQTATVSNPFF